MVQYIPNAGTTEVSDTGFTPLLMGFWHMRMSGKLAIDPLEADIPMYNVAQCIAVMDKKTRSTTLAKQAF